MKEDGWEEFLDDTDWSLVTPYQLSTEDNLLASQTAGKMRSESAAPIIPSPAVSGKYAGWKEGTVIVKVKDPGPDGFLGDSYVRKLEENFRANHLFGRTTEDVDEGMVDVVKGAQVYEHVCMYEDTFSLCHSQ